MPCGCGGGKAKAAKPAKEKLTTGAWKLTLPNGEVEWFDTRIGAAAENIRRHNSKGVVERA